MSQKLGEFPLVLLPDGELGEALLRLAANWSALGFLSESLWIKPSGVQKNLDGVMSIQAVVMDFTPQGVRQREVNLHAWLGVRQVNAIRFTVLQVVGPRFGPDLVQNALVEELRQSLYELVPVSLGADVNAQTSKFVCYNLVCSPAGYKSEALTTLYKPGFDANIVPSPEEPATPWAGAAPLQDGPELYGFALAHLASLQGLWAGMSRGYLEVLAERGKATRPGQVLVPRVNASLVLTDGLAKRLIVEALDRVANPQEVLYRGETANSGERPRAYAVEDDEAIGQRIDVLVDQILELEDGVLKYTPFVQKPRAELEAMKTGRRIRAFFKFSGDKLKKIPYWAGQWFKYHWDRMVMRNVEGEQVAEQTRSIYDEKPDQRHKDLLARLEEVIKIREDHKLQTKLIVEPIKLKSSEALWQKVRNIVFANLDGGIGIEPRENPVIPLVSQVLYNPEAKFEMPAVEGVSNLPKTLTWNDLAIAGESRQKIESVVASESAAVDEASLAAEVAQFNLEKLTTELAGYEGELEVLKAVEVAETEGADK